MLRRSDIRHACYRAKNGLITDKIKPILELVEPLLDVTQRWENFTSVWDIILDSDGKIHIIKPEVDYSFVHNTLLEKSLYESRGWEMENVTARAANIIEYVDVLRLEGVMEWSSYNRTWGIEIDRDTKQIKTKQFNIKPTQFEVTEEMIEASKKSDGAAMTEVPSLPTVEVDMEPVPESEKALYDMMLKKDLLP